MNGEKGILRYRGIPIEQLAEYSSFRETVYLLINGKLPTRPDPLLDLAKKLESAALEDSYFVEKNLYSNVDFYSGIVLRAIGIPTNMFPVMFAIGRLPGWIAQWKESMDDPRWKFNRPRQIYGGPNKTAYIPMDER